MSYDPAVPFLVFLAKRGKLIFTSEPFIMFRMFLFITQTQKQPYISFAIENGSTNCSAVDPQYRMEFTLADSTEDQKYSRQRFQKFQKSEASELPCAAIHIHSIYIVLGIMINLEIFKVLGDV